MHNTFIFGILIIIILAALILLVKANAIKDKNEHFSYVLLNLGLNLIFLPVTIFTGYIIVQIIPIVMLFIALVWFILGEKKVKEKL